MTPDHALADSWSADLFLIHAPSVYDFRERDDVMFAYLSDSDSVNVTSVYEMYPLGFFAIQARLRAHGFTVEIINLASLMLMFPSLDVDKFLARLRAPVFGFDIHWMPHCHGAVELARRVKAIHPDALTLTGGISATYFADAIAADPAIDIVVQGYDTLQPMTELMETIRSGRREFGSIPNLVYRTKSGDVARTGFTHTPLRQYNDVTVDWSFYKGAVGTLGSSRQIMTLPNTGCAHDCNWCGGSRYAYRQMMGVTKTLITKDHSRVVDELRALAGQGRTTSIYALQCYSETKQRLYDYLEAVREVGIKSVFFEQFRLTDAETLTRMGRATQSYIMLSPESHDPAISKLAGRGTYTMEEMEAWLPRAFDAGIAGVFVWFFIGMPQQTEQSIQDTVSYCRDLLQRFKGRTVVPLICPMVPFLDPGSRFFEQPDAHGYRIFHRTFADHRRAMVEPVWHRRLNYETIWLSRRQIQDVTYEAIGRLVTIKGDLGMLPPRVCTRALRLIDETTRLMAEVDRACAGAHTAPSSLRSAIREYNTRILAYSSDQVVPIERPFGNRWFDDFATPRHLVRACGGVPAAASA